MLLVLKLLKPCGQLLESRLLLTSSFRLTHTKIKNFPQQENFDVEFDDEAEADFVNLPSSSKEFITEAKTLKEKEKFLIVKQKYFKETAPNFLTWSEKEQIRYLHQSDPETWTIDKLSEGFPALPETIKKIVKSSWTKSNLNKIKNHDKSVQKNWEIFKKGKIPDIPVELKKHLKKFVLRNNDEEHRFIYENTSKTLTNIKPAGEFAEIIKSYKNTKNEISNDNNNKIQDINYKKVKEESYLLTPKSEFKNKKHVQLKFSKSKEDVNCFKEEEQLVTTIPDSLFEDCIEETNSSEISETKLVTVKKKEKDYSFLVYPEKITVPGKLKKPGHIYKLKDCYYSEDGEFLYRVPGMIE